MENKRCTKCKNIYPATKEYFFPDKRMVSGLQSWCKQCKHAYNREYNKINRFKKVERDKENIKRGSSHYAAKLSESDIPLILELCESLTTTTIARKFDVSNSTILKIKACVTWTHV